MATHVGPTASDADRGDDVPEIAHSGSHRPGGVSDLLRASLHATTSPVRVGIAGGTG